MGTNMSSSWHGGKGDRVRSGSNLKQYAENWDVIFGKNLKLKPKEKQTPNKKSTG